MPNGDPNWGKEVYPKLEQFFAKIASVIEGFAELHNLKIEKYYHQFPSWDLQFRHPMGGVGQIEIGRDGEESLYIFTCWWKDSFEENRRYLKQGQKEMIAVKTLNQEYIEQLFQKVISWKENDLNPLLANDLSEIYAWTIDFFGLQEGDKFKLIYDKKLV